MGLAIGTLALEPTFDKDVFEYTATTTNATNKVTATPEDPSAEITIELNDVEIENGDSAEWETGENEIKVTVHGHPDSVYTVVVTKEAEQEQV